MRAARGVAFLLVVFLAGCVSRAGVAEFQIYNSGFEKSQSVSIQIIDMLSAAEREQGQRARLKAYGVGSAFVVADASLYSELADPPVAAEFRRAVNVIAQYNKLMIVYATGKGFDGLVSDIAALANESTSLLAMMAPASAANKVLQPSIAILERFARLPLSYRSRDAFRAVLLTSAPEVRDLMESLRDGAPIIFQRLTNSITEELNRARFGGSAEKAALVEKDRQVRKLLSD